MERYLDGELLPEKVRVFEAHLRACPKCRKELETKREQRRLRIHGLIPEEVPLTTEDIIAAVCGDVPARQPRGEVIPLATPPGWWEKFRSFAFRPAPAIAFALCIVALGLSLFLPFGILKNGEPGIVIENIQSSSSVVIFQSEHADTTLIWIVPNGEDQEAT